MWGNKFLILLSLRVYQIFIVSAVCLYFVIHSLDCIFPGKNPYLLFGLVSTLESLLIISLFITVHFHDFPEMFPCNEFVDLCRILLQLTSGKILWQKLSILHQTESASIFGKIDGKSMKSSFPAESDDIHVSPPRV